MGGECELSNLWEKKGDSMTEIQDGIVVKNMNSD